jgi:hypothetical protein
MEDGFGIAIDAINAEIEIIDRVVQLLEIDLSLPANQEMFQKKFDLLQSRDAVRSLAQIHRPGRLAQETFITQSR